MKVTKAVEVEVDKKRPNEAEYLKMVHSRLRLISCSNEDMLEHMSEWKGWRQGRQAASLLQDENKGVHGGNME